MVWPLVLYRTKPTVAGDTPASRATSAAVVVRVKVLLTNSLLESLQKIVARVKKPC
jgi:hypothetical protein